MQLTSQTFLRGLGVLVLILVLLPLVFLVLQAGTLATTEALGVFGRADTWYAVLRTLSIGVGVAVLCVALALPLAWLTHSTDLPGRRFFQIALNLPLAVPSYVSGFVIMATLGQAGWLHELILAPLGVTQMPDIRGGVGATLALLYSYPFALLTLQATLQSLDPRVWEAAQSMGCTPWQAWWRVILPQLKAPLVSGGLLIALYTVGDFGAVSLLRYKSLSYIIYLRQESLSDLYRSEAVFLALLLVVIAVALVIASTRVKAPTQALSAQSHGRPWPIIPLGRWRWPAFILCSVVALLGVALPVLVVLGWLIRGLNLGHTIPFPGAATSITLALATVAALIVLAIAAVPALLSRFGDPATGKLVTFVSHIGYALPGIVVALALLSAVTAYAYPLYQTVYLLLIAYAVRFLPLAVHTLREALMRQNPGLYDAARSLGCSPPQAWYRVIFPTSRVALWAGWLAVFIAILKELPITLLLSPIDVGSPVLDPPLRFETLATRIWSLTADAYFSEVAPVVLLLLLLAAAGLVVGPGSHLKKQDKPRDRP